jgi:Tol biopolymer transport system component
MTIRVSTSRLAGSGFIVMLLVVAGGLPAAAYPRPGATERVSISSDGAQTPRGDPSFAPVTSDDGRYVAFHSLASNLVAGDSNDAYDVFVRDREAHTTERVSVASDGTEGNSGSFLASITADGRFVAFHSVATDLVADDTNGKMDVFVHDRETRVTERVSVATGGGEVHPATWWSGWPSISADGRYVAFESDAPDLVAGDANDQMDVFLHDRGSGVTTRVSVASDGSEANSASSRPSISADGVVAFQSFASNLVPGDGNGVNDIFVHDHGAGTTERVSVATGGSEANEASLRGAISADGRYVAFEGWSSNLVPGDTNGSADVFVHDRGSGITERVSVSSSGEEGSTHAQYPAISEDGRYVLFDSGAPNLTPGGGGFHVYLHDRGTGATEKVSSAMDGSAADGESYVGSLSADGRFAAFQSTASNLAPGITNGTTDTFVRDRGPAVGVGVLSAHPDGEGVSVSGWTTFTGQSVASAGDPSDDGAPGAKETGGELTGAGLAVRPEQEDLLASLRVASLPGLAPRGGFGAVSTGAGAPAILYGLAFDAGGARYEVRALRVGATEVPPAAPSFGLYRCDPDCTEQARLSGGIGTTGHEVLISIPISALGAQEEAGVEEVRAFTALGEAAPGDLVIIDEVDLPDAVLPAARVELGIAPADTPEEEVAFTTQAEVVDGHFAGTLDVSSVPSGAHRVWGRACLGQRCGTRSVAVTL